MQQSITARIDARVVITRIKIPASASALSRLIHALALLMSLNLPLAIVARAKECIARGRNIANSLCTSPCRLRMHFLNDIHQMTGLSKTHFAQAGIMARPGLG